MSSAEAGVSDGPTMVNVGAHPPTADFQVTKGAQTHNVDYYEGLLAQSAVSLASKEGDSVSASALDIVEALSVKNSASVWIFDDAKEVGFGAKALKWGDELHDTEVIDLQTRAGAGSGLAGFLANKVFVEDATLKTVSVLATTATLPLLLPVLSLLPSTSSSKIVIHLATTTVDAKTLQLHNSLDALIPLLPSISTDKFTILFSSTPQDIVQTTASAYSPHHSKNVINIIESTYAGRQINDLRIPALPSVHATPAFTPYGPISTASSVFLVPAGHTANVIVASQITSEVGSSAVIVLHSWDNVSGLSKLVSGGKKKLFLINESEESQSVLKENVLAALYDPLGSPSKHVFPCIKSIVIPHGADVFESIKAVVPTIGEIQIEQELKTVSLFTNATEPFPELLAQLFMASPSLITKLDRYGSSVARGVKSILTLRPQKKNTPFPPVTVNGEKSDVVWVTEPQLIKQSDIFQSLKENSLLVLVTPWGDEEVESKLSKADRAIIKSRKVRVFLLPPTDSPVVQAAAFLMLYTSSKFLSHKVRSVLSAYFEGNVSREAIEEAQANLTEVDGIADWNTEVEEGEKEEATKEAWEWDAVAGRAGIVDAHAEGRPVKGDWALAAKHFLFKEAFEYGAEIERDEELKEKAILDLRPSLEDKTYLVKVSENRRLTPETYDRNVFHIAFDTTGTGLKYEVGEALGIHGWNDKEEVKEFIDWYGLNADDLVSVPSPHDNGKTYETRTVFQLLQQNLDLFGKPPKSFYASLATLAKDRNEQRTLRFIAAPEGVALFKKMSESETVTFADVLRQFKSARPSIEELVGIVPEIKPRHYSIASANALVGDCVELLIVTVNWATPTGTPRFGQCTRYLASLPVGSEVTVSIKPSVMKLPPLDTQPIIMAGLGTGAAPFRAFIQHRAWQKSQGMEVGPLVYYFGSRYRSQEYLYGEEIEAYIAGGIITHAGLAFSRDGKEKSYIQHKMGQDKKLLAKLLTAENEADKAYFHLCGPTWPVPDVYEALVGSFTQEAGKSREDAEAYIEELKEAERYVLEVY